MTFLDDFFFFEDFFLWNSQFIYNELSLALHVLHSDQTVRLSEATLSEATKRKSNSRRKMDHPTDKTKSIHLRIHSCHFELIGQFNHVKLNAEILTRKRSIQSIKEKKITRNLSIKVTWRISTLVRRINSIDKQHIQWHKCLIMRLR